MRNTYKRVIPRDLFNESKLLKCLGLLALHIHNGCDNVGNQMPDKLKAEQTENGEFRIDQRYSDGGLFVWKGVLFRVGRHRLTLYSSYNSQAAYPLLCATNGSEVNVFEDSGEITAEFIQYVNELSLV